MLSGSWREVSPFDHDCLCGILMKLAFLFAPQVFRHKENVRKLAYAYQNQNVSIYLQPWALRNQSLLSSAYSAFSEEKNCLVFCNLYDGFTICTFSPYFFDTEVFPIENADNIPLPVRIIHGGNDILTGSPLGQVQIAPLARLTSIPHSTYLSHNSQ